MRTRVEFILADGVERSWEVEHENDLELSEEGEIWDGDFLFAALPGAMSIRLVATSMRTVEPKEEAQGKDWEDEVFPSIEVDPSGRGAYKAKIAELRKTIEGLSTAEIYYRRDIDSLQERRADLERMNANQQETIKAAGEEIRHLNSAIHLLREELRKKDLDKAFDSARIRATTEHGTAQRIADWIKAYPYKHSNEVWHELISRGAYRQVKP